MRGGVRNNTKKKREDSGILGTFVARTGRLTEQTKNTANHRKCLEMLKLSKCNRPIRGCSKDGSEDALDDGMIGLSM